MVSGKRQITLLHQLLPTGVVPLYKLIDMAKKSIKWTEGQLILSFGLNRVYEGMPIMDKWLQAKGELSDEDRATLEKLRVDLFKRVEYWNEETLKMRFIAFLLDLANYNTDRFQTFFDAELTAEVEAHTLKIKADFVVATAVADLITAPYFCFHEYKLERKQSDDPVAQVLLAMLIGQTKNPKPHPIYGCYVMGRSWFFMVLDGKDFIVSNAFNATETDDLQRILLILREFKVILTEQLLK